MGAIFETEEEESKINESKNVGSPTKPPLLFFLGEFSWETKHGFFDPIRRTFDVVHLKELERQAECLASRYGWLLILSRETSSLFFFNPLMRQRIDLPYSYRIITAAAFSAPPTSPNCTVYAIKSSTFNVACELHIDTFLMGQESWIPHSYKSTTKPLIGNVVQAVCSKEVLYCVDSRGRVGAFDVKIGNWTVFPGKEFQKVCTISLMEFNGAIFAAKKGAYGVIEKLYKLSIEHGIVAWEEEKDLGDFSVFVGPYGSCGVSAPNKETKGKLFVADCGPESKCVVYNVDGMDYKKASRFLGGSFSRWYTPVWIER
jgi:hypothetical protein